MLTNAQLQTLKTFIEGDPTLSAFPNNDDGAFAIAALLNADSNPAFIVWRPSVSINEIMSNGFDWARVDNIDASKARIWEWMTQVGTIEPAKANVRAGIEAAWPTAGNAAQRAAIYVHCKRTATVFEKIFASGEGSSAVPATMAVVGQVSYADVSSARNLA